MRYFANIKVPLHIDLTDWDEDDPKSPKTKLAAAQMLCKKFEDVVAESEYFSGDGDVEITLIQEPS
jgi:hypothetical protein